MEKIILNLFQYSRATYYSWKREKRPIILLIEKYFTKEDLEEFLQTNEISKLKNLDHYENILNIQFSTFYRKYFTSGEKFNHFFWEFIHLYKNKIVSIKSYNLNENKILLNEYLLDYYSYKLEINKEIDNHPVDYLKSKLSYFITLMQELNVELLDFFIKNVELNFRPLINYLLNNKLHHFADEIEQSIQKKVDYKK
ncbi:hypothetical protein [Aliarcobacter butzleri]|uniref:hypothetical protein n=1 Tax=Aliarcobacter butzleri TaxID=28197 RepID=UPI0021B30514|nr:hypothetical protein [Aliarcobacter butzleri]MCT7553827.1 hypothetical protein [Aliarcobacter butzleri]